VAVGVSWGPGSGVLLLAVEVSAIVCGLFGVGVRSLGLNVLCWICGSLTWGCGVCRELGGLGLSEESRP
jgi:hypothetical protein